MPLPAGLVAAVAGSLVAQGRDERRSGAGTLAVTASVAGDVVGYGLGRAGQRALPRSAGAAGSAYTPARRARVAGLLDRYDVADHAAQPHAGVGLEFGGQPAGRHRPLSAWSASWRWPSSAACCWTSAYLGLGYGRGRRSGSGHALPCRTWPGCWWRWPC
ncbi:MAG: hypothetical protein MZU91_12515 [Desulfosudis oleivorans]|nr:hypothetical protein [Desulfosudis oleivorans]